MQLAGELPPIPESGGLTSEVRSKLFRLKRRKRGLSDEEKAWLARLKALHPDVNIEPETQAPAAEGAAPSSPPAANLPTVTAPALPPAAPAAQTAGPPPAPATTMDAATLALKPTPAATPRLGVALTLDAQRRAELARLADQQRQAEAANRANDQELEESIRKTEARLRETEIPPNHHAKPAPTPPAVDQGQSPPTPPAGFCGMCGNAIPGGWRFCGQCGAQRTPRTIDSQADAAKPLPPPPPVMPADASLQLAQGQRIDRIVDSYTLREVHLLRRENNVHTAWNGLFGIQQTLIGFLMERLGTAEGNQIEAMARIREATLSATQAEVALAKAENNTENTISTLKELAKAAPELMPLVEMAKTMLPAPKLPPPAAPAAPAKS